MRARLTGAMVVSIVSAYSIIMSAQPGRGPAAPIRLAAGTFTPARGDAPPVPSGLRIAGYAEEQRGYYLVQFSGPVMDAWKSEVTATGAEVLEYIPEYAFKVRNSCCAIHTLRGP